MEYIAEAALKDEKTSIVYHMPRPARHSDVFYFLYVQDPSLKTRDFTQGFVTNENRFVDRFEAAKIAKDANQIVGNEFNGTCLYSEDVW